MIFKIKSKRIFKKVMNNNRKRSPRKSWSPMKKPMRQIRSKTPLLTKIQLKNKTTSPLKKTTRQRLTTVSLNNHTTKSRPLRSLTKSNRRWMNLQSKRIHSQRLKKKRSKSSQLLPLEVRKTKTRKKIKRRRRSRLSKMMKKTKMNKSNQTKQLRLQTQLWRKKLT